MSLVRMGNMIFGVDHVIWYLGRQRQELGAA